MSIPHPSTSDKMQRAGWARLYLSQWILSTRLLNYHNQQLLCSPYAILSVYDGEPFSNRYYNCDKSRYGFVFIDKVIKRYGEILSGNCMGNSYWVIE